MASSEMQVMFFRNGAMNMAMFYSTRGAQAGVSAPEAVLRGIAPDGGLYVLKDAPQVLPQDLRGMDFSAHSLHAFSQRGCRAIPRMRSQAAYRAHIGINSTCRRLRR